MPANASQDDDPYRSCLIKLKEKLKKCKNTKKGVLDTCNKVKKKYDLIEQEIEQIDKTIEQLRIQRSELSNQAQTKSKKLNIRTKLGRFSKITKLQTSISNRIILLECGDNQTRLSDRIALLLSEKQKRREQLKLFQSWIKLLETLLSRNDEKISDLEGEIRKNERAMEKGIPLSTYDLAKINTLLYQKNQMAPAVLVSNNRIPEPMSSYSKGYQKRKLY